MIGVNDEPSDGSTRIAFLTVFLTSLIVFSMYNASLTSVLAISKVVMPFEDTESLYLSTNFKVATASGSSYANMLKNGNDIERKIYRERLIQVQSVSEGLEKTLVQDVALLWSQPLVTELIGDKCTHARASKCFYSGPIAWAIRKDFQYAGFINHQYVIFQSCFLPPNKIS